MPAFKTPVRQHLQDFQHGYSYTFSVRNGFGPAHTVPEESPDEVENIRLSRELHSLMSSLTAVEEAAIRQISPLISILRLTSGNIGSKGNTSCVWQHSKLTQVLPNLPSQCNYIILRRGNASSNSFKSTKFERHKIQRVLVLLKQTGHDAWKDINISTANINAWPESGDLCNHIEELVVHEVDDDDNVMMNMGGSGEGMMVFKLLEMEMIPVQLRSRMMSSRLKRLRVFFPLKQ